MLLDGLNDRQREAVTLSTGPALILAGPGSGKTRVLTHRIAYLINQMNVPPSAIMAVTFTNKAAGEMRERVEQIINQQTRGLSIGTFHAICARLLRREGEHTPFGSDYVIYDTDDQLSVVSQALNELNVNPKKFTPRQVLSKISDAKNELITPSEYPSLDYLNEIVGRVYTRYQSILLDNNALDFDDLLMQMVVLLQDKPSILNKYQRMFEFVLVDEFQDTNMAQYQLVKLIAEPQNNLFVVGDEDQGIYAFRGADYRNVMRFKENYPQTRVILLEQNYRSTQTILDAARAVIQKNPNRTPKTLFTERTDNTKIEIHEAYNEEFEARYVIDKIRELFTEDGLQWSDFAVMYRTNAQSRAIEEACIREGVPYRLIGGVGFYKRREVRDLLAYLRVIHNGNDRVSFARIINTPRRGIGNKSLSDFQIWAANTCDNYDEALEKLINGEETPLPNRTVRNFVTFGHLLKKWQQIAATGDLLTLIDMIIADIGYSMYLAEISDTDEQAIERQDNIQELRALVAKAQDDEMGLAEFLAEQSLVADVDSLAEEMDTVTLMTLHAAKGLEFPVVFITGVEEGMLPHQRSFDDSEAMGEERRLMYVGITRAKDHLFLSYAFRRMIWGSSTTNVPSRFISDLPQGLAEGLPVRATAEAEIRNFREQTAWKPMANARPTIQPKSDSSSKIRGKIMPFPGSKAATTTPQKYKTGDRVRHKVFGKGIILESWVEGGIELVNIAFEDKSQGIKKSIDADFILPL